ncbi:MAG: hypothetical protein QXF41_02885 [Candidatus Micrarchaeaceae archaeon]
MNGDDEDVEITSISVIGRIKKNKRGFTVYIDNEEVINELDNFIKAIYGDGKIFVIFFERGIAITNTDGIIESTENNNNKKNNDYGGAYL